jgi:hypothetical protein
MFDPLIFHVSNMIYKVIVIADDMVVEPGLPSEHRHV